MTAHSQLAVYFKSRAKIWIFAIFFRPVEKDPMLKKRLEAETEMWDLWRMGEEDEAVSSEDTDFACRCVKKTKTNFLIKDPVHDIVKLLYCKARREPELRTRRQEGTASWDFPIQIFSLIKFSRLLIIPIPPSRIFRKFAAKVDQVQCQDLSRSPGIKEKKIFYRMFNVRCRQAVIVCHYWQPVFVLDNSEIIAGNTGINDFGDQFTCRLSTITDD